MECGVKLDNNHRINDTTFNNGYFLNIDAVKVPKDRIEWKLSQMNEIIITELEKVDVFNLCSVC